MKPIAIVAGAFAGGVLAVLLLERLSAGARRAAPARRAGRAMADRGTPDDAGLRQRVRSRLGDWVSHPGAIDVDVQSGVVRVSGQVLAAEIDGLLSRITGIAGVRKVHNALEALRDPGGFGEAAAAQPQSVAD